MSMDNRDLLMFALLPCDKEDLEKAKEAGIISDYSIDYSVNNFVPTERKTIVLCSSIGSVNISGSVTV
jgi:hypothetical protein